MNLDLFEIHYTVKSRQQRNEKKFTSKYYANQNIVSTQLVFANGV